MSSVNAGRNIYGEPSGNFVSVVFSFSLANSSKSFLVNASGDVACENLNAAQQISCSVLIATSVTFVNLLVSGLLTAGAFANSGGTFVVTSAGDLTSDSLSTGGPCLAETFTNTSFSFNVSSSGNLTAASLSTAGACVAQSFTNTSATFVATAGGALTASSVSTSGSCSAQTVSATAASTAQSFANLSSTFGVSSTGDVTANTVSVYNGSGYTDLQAEITTLQSQVTSLQSSVTALESTPQTPIAWALLTYDSGSNTISLVAGANLTYYWLATLPGQIGVTYSGSQTPQYFAVVNLMTDPTAGAAPMFTMTQSNATPFLYNGSTPVNWLVYTWDALGTPTSSSLSIFLY